jgi:ferritin-like metal-binding protein YciE
LQELFNAEVGTPRRYLHTRLEKIFAIIDKKPQGKTCDAIVGITDEGARG